MVSELCLGYHFSKCGIRARTDQLMNGGKLTSQKFYSFGIWRDLLLNILVFFTALVPWGGVEVCVWVWLEGDGLQSVRWTWVWIPIWLLLAGWPWASWLTSLWWFPCHKKRLSSSSRGTYVMESFKRAWQVQPFSACDSHIAGVSGGRGSMVRCPDICELCSVNDCSLESPCWCRCSQWQRSANLLDFLLLNFFLL